MTRTLWPHQVKAHEMVRDAMRRGHRWVTVVQPTGTGKTFTGAEFVRQHLVKKPDGKVLWIAHREELVGQAFDSLTSHGLSCGVIQAKPVREVNPYRSVQIASIQTMIARDIVVEGVTLFVYDECFVAGTSIDGVPIEQIQVGDIVRCVDHRTGDVTYRLVTETRKKRPTSLVRVNGVVCTPNHPFFVPGEGYVRADNLEGKWILRDLRFADSKASQDMQRRVQERSVVSDNASHEQGTQSSVLSSRTDAGFSEPNARSLHEGGSLCQASADWSSTEDPRGQRYGADRHSAGPVEILSSGGTRVRSGDREGSSQEWSGEQLQAGSGVSQSPAGNRDRWLVPLRSRPQGAGHEEADLLYLERVDSVEVLEPGSDGTFGGLCPDGYVYNFGVDEHHNYFAEGVLVHNCHHALSESWSKFALDYKQKGVFGIGLTATPIRADGLPLGDVWDELVVPITMREAIDAGFLVPYELCEPGRKLGKNEIAQSPCAAYLEHAQGRKTIVFANSIANATTFRDEFRAAGITSEIVTGAMDALQRRTILQEYSEGKIRVLCNVGVLGEGYDDPDTSCVILARSVASLVLYLQFFGRALRISPKTGKTSAILIDLHGSCHKDGFGEPDADRDWSLDGDGVRKAKLPTAPERFCTLCGCTLEADATICPDCGSLGQGSKPPEIVGVPLVKYARMRKYTDEQKQTCLLRWMREAHEAAHKEGKALHKYKAVFGDWPSREWVRFARDKISAGHI